MRLPPIGAQTQIANILASFDDKIELNRELNQTLEAMVQTLFNSWFVDFDPVIDNALAAGNPIPEPFAVRAERRRAYLATATDNTRPHPQTLSPELRYLFPAEFVETDELGWIPKGWEVSKCEELAEKIGMGPFGSNIKVSTFVAEGVPVISGQHLNEIHLSGNQFNYVTAQHALKLKNSKVWSGDLIFTHAGNIGQVSLLPDDTDFQEYILSQRQFYLRPKSERVLGSYLVLYFRSHVGQFQLLSNASQVGVPSIARPTSHLKNIEIIVPRIGVQKVFDKFFTGFTLSIRQNKNQISSLKLIRDALLPKLLSGQVRIPDAEGAA